ncbi:PucR family transcriptional regulator [Lentzea kentuckyensis]|uniref:PucR family transcriptional regulator n=1 Tax=Lentzea kentuckyensis TaxID=360086 RepID=UPI001B801E9A|nr:PucR family transcriptional regulator [Lentzea kentuckyensis]
MYEDSATVSDRGAAAGPARTLRVAGDRELLLAAFRAKVREAGEQWSNGSTAGLSELLCEAAAHDPELARIARAGGQLLEVFLEGLSRNEVASLPHDLAAELIDGRQLPREALDRLASAYTVVLARFPAERRVGQPSADLARRGVLCTRRSGALVLLVPAGKTDLVTDLTGRLSVEGWVVTAKRAVAELENGYAEARDVLRLVLAGRRPAGVYTIADVLVEHAVTSNDVITAQLTEIIRPLSDHPVLWQTLVALLDADFSRKQAAKDLFIHRSTLDYRLRRIAKVTGYDPGTARGVQVLSAALIAEAVA